MRVISLENRKPTREKSIKKALVLIITQGLFHYFENFNIKSQIGLDQGSKFKTF